MILFVELLEILNLDILYLIVYIFCTFLYLSFLVFLLFISLVLFIKFIFSRIEKMSAKIRRYNFIKVIGEGQVEMKRYRKLKLPFC
jgi:hypothetical protein